MKAAAATATMGGGGTMSSPSRGPGSSNSPRGYGNDQQLLVQRQRHSHHGPPAPPSSSYRSSLSWTRRAHHLHRKLVRIGPPPQHRMHPSHSPELTASSTSSSYVSTLSLSSSAPQIAFASIPEDRVVVAESSLHSSASWDGASASPAQGKIPFPVGRWTAAKTTALAGLESKRLDPLDLRCRTIQPALAPSPTQPALAPSPSPPRPAVAHKGGAALDTFHLRFNRCDAEGLPCLRRLRGNFPIVITEDDEEGEAGETKQAGADGGADALSSPPSSPPRSPQSPYEMLRDFAGASSWWHHPHYCPSSALMRSLSCQPPPPPAARRDVLLGS